MDSKMIAIGGGIIGLVVLVILWRARQDVIAIGSAGLTAAKAINPLNPNNVISGAVNNLGSQLTGNNSFSLGAWLYNETHPASQTP